MRRVPAAHDAMQNRGGGFEKTQRGEGFCSIVVSSKVGGINQCAEYAAANKFPSKLNCGRYTERGTRSKEGRRQEPTVLPNLDKSHGWTLLCELLGFKFPGTDRVLVRWWTTERRGAAGAS